MSNVTIIGIDLAKRVFHAHGAHIDGSVAFRKRLTRAQVMPFLAAQPTCVVAMEACASAHLRMSGGVRSRGSIMKFGSSRPATSSPT